MNSSHIKGTWKRMRGLFREKWGRLTDSALDVIAGRRDRVIGTLQQRYGTAKDVVEHKVTAIERRVSRVLPRH